MADLRESLTQALDQDGAPGLEAACRLALSEARGLDPAGAAEVLRGEPELGRRLAACLAAEAPAAALAELARELTALAEAARCLGCGTCCRVSSPTLYAEDLDRLGPAGLPREGLYALRAGERVFSARLGQSQALPRELIKLREAPRGGCVFLEGGRCGVYPHRPLQCRQLECWSGRHAGQLAARPRLTRAELFADDPTALALMEEYEARLPGAELAQVLDQALQGGDPSPALARLELDHRLRLGIEARYGYDQAQQDLLLGRPARVVALAHGLELALDPQDRPCLVRARGTV